MAVVKKLLSWEDPMFSGITLALVNVIFFLVWIFDYSVVYFVVSGLMLTIVAASVCQIYSGTEGCLEKSFCGCIHEDHLKEVYECLYTKINCGLDCLRSVMLMKCTFKTVATLVGALLISSVFSWFSHYMCFWILTNAAFVAPLVKIKPEHKAQAKEVWSKLNAQLDEVLAKVPSYQQIERQDKYRVIEEVKKEEPKKETKKEEPKKEEPKKEEPKEEVKKEEPKVEAPQPETESKDETETQETNQM